MTPIEFKFQPEDVRISSEEILADLNYPAPAERIRSSKVEQPRRKPRR
jgi:hypothetical protein